MGIQGPLHMLKCGVLKSLYKTTPCVLNNALRKQPTSKEEDFGGISVIEGGSHYVGLAGFEVTV